MEVFSTKENLDKKRFREATRQILFSFSILTILRCLRGLRPLDTYPILWRRKNPKTPHLGFKMSRFRPSLRVNFLILEMCLCKKIDKYHVWKVLSLRIRALCTGLFKLWLLRYCSQANLRILITRVFEFRQNWRLGLFHKLKCMTYVGGHIAGQLYLYYKLRCCFTNYFLQPVCQPPPPPPPS